MCNSPFAFNLLVLIHQFFSMKKILLLLTICFATVSSINAQGQTKDELQKKESDLKREITELTNQLTKYQVDRKSSVKAAAAVQRKIAAREELMNNISRQVKAIDETIYQNELEIYRMKKELDTLKTKYAQSIVFAYKNRSSYQALNFLFSATSFNDGLKRMTYLKSYRKLRETQVDNIVKTQNLLQQKMGSLTANKKEQTVVLQNQKGEIQNLEKDKKEKEQVVRDLKSQEKEITAQLRKKEKQRQDMKNTIAAIIRRETIEAEKREKLAKQKALDDEKKRLAQEKAANKPDNIAKNDGGKTAPKPKPVITSATTGLAGSNGETRVYTTLEGSREGFEESIKFERRNLPWPVSIGTVVIPFGSYSSVGKIIGVNDGIDIALPVGTAVKAVADGKVSYVGDVGGEQVVIVKHGKYFTSYSHLSSVSVSREQMVKAGTVLGSSGTDDDGQGMMQFMVTNDKGTPLNPKSWLKAR